STTLGTLEPEFAGHGGGARFWVDRSVGLTSAQGLLFGDAPRGALVRFPRALAVQIAVVRFAVAVVPVRCRAVDPRSAHGFALGEEHAADRWSAPHRVGERRPSLARRVALHHHAIRLLACVIVATPERKHEHQTPPSRPRTHHAV